MAIEGILDKSLDPLVSDCVVDQLTRGVDDLLGDGKTIAVEGEMFVGAVVGVSYPRNPDFWAKSIDISCTSQYYSVHVPNQRRLTIVTPRHGIASTHYHVYNEGETYGFVSMDGEYVTRTIQKVIETETNDTTIILLNEDLPPSIKPCKIAPSNWGDFISLDLVENIASGYTIPILSINQHDQGEVHSFWATNEGTNYTFAYYKIPTEPDQLAMWGHYIHKGDSGCPCFFIYKGEPLLISLWWTTTGGPAQPEQVDFVNSTIAEVDALVGINTGYVADEGEFEPVALEGKVLVNGSTDESLEAAVIGSFGSAINEGILSYALGELAVSSHGNVSSPVDGILSNALGDVSLVSSGFGIPWSGIDPVDIQDPSPTLSSMLDSDNMAVSSASFGEESDEQITYAGGESRASETSAGGEFTTLITEESI